MIRLLPVLALCVACNPPLTDDIVDDDFILDSGLNPGVFAFSTPAWVDGAAIPVEYTCDSTLGWASQDNPELVWENPPTGTEAFAVIYVDTDLGNWEHWAFYTTNADVLSIPRGTSNTTSLPAGVVELDSNRLGYIPNCPGPTAHTYTFTIWAVSDASMLTTATTFTALETAAAANSLGTLSFTGEAATL